MTRAPQRKGQKHTVNALRASAYSIAGALISLLVVAGTRLGLGLGGTDFDQLWVAARAALAGDDPYASVVRVGMEFPYYYPGTATTLAMPLAVLDLWSARVVAVLLVGGTFGYVLGRYRPELWPALLSTPFLISARNIQLAPLLTAALVLPWLGWVGAAKPTLGLAMLAGQRTLRGAAILVGGGLLLVALSLMLDPDWPRQWRSAMRDAEHFSPLLFRPGGFLMLAGLLAWRDPDTRLLLGLAVMPGTGLFYDCLPACLVARTRAQSATLTLLTQLGSLATNYAPSQVTLVGSYRATGTLVLWTVLLPALALVVSRSRRWRLAGGRSLMRAD